MCEVHVERLGKTDCEAKVRLKTVDGNVKANTAYGVLSETITFAPGETMRSVGIPIKADYAWGKGAFFNVAIERVGEGVAELFEKQTRAKIMLSSEKHHKICNWIETRHQVVSGDSHATLFLSRGTHLNVATKVRIVTRDGSAKAGIHYRPLPKEQIEFAPGVTSKSIKVALIDWAADEVKAVNFFVDVFEDEDETGNENGHEIQVDIAHKNALQREGWEHVKPASERTETPTASKETEAPSASQTGNEEDPKSSGNRPVKPKSSSDKPKSRGGSAKPKSSSGQPKSDSGSAESPKSVTPESDRDGAKVLMPPGVGGIHTPPKGWPEDTPEPPWGYPTTEEPAQGWPRMPEKGWPRTPPRDWPGMIKTEKPGKCCGAARM
ncbi:MAG: Calx-beta domain-containing protein [Promethearchaeia archaeon]